MTVPGPDHLENLSSFSCKIRARCGALVALAGLAHRGAGHAADRISDHALPLAGGVEIGKGGAGSAMAHTVHQLA